MPHFQLLPHGRVGRSTTALRKSNNLEVWCEVRLTGVRSRWLQPGQTELAERQSSERCGPACQCEGDSPRRDSEGGTDSWP
jgi:hypothetical protein